MKSVPTTTLALHTEPLSLLSPPELEALTGTADTDQQIHWLRKQQISFLIGVDQLPKVIWQAVSACMVPELPPDPYGEFLREDELAALVGAKTRLRQIEWLDAYGWCYERNAADRPIVGRVYARLKLAGVKSGAQAAVQEPRLRLKSSGC